LIAPTPDNAVQHPTDIRPRRDPNAWFRQPILWLGAAIFVASVLGCVALIMLTTQ